MLSIGSHIVTSALEHNSVLRPLHALHARGMISLSIVAPRGDGRVHADDLRAALRANTRLCVLTHASNVTGAVQDIEGIGRMCLAHGVPLLVDGAQSAGSLPVHLEDMPGITLYALAGHKGLLGPQGCGALYIREGCYLRPLREGGTGSQSLLLTQPADMPDQYESGTQPAALLAAWREGIRYVQTHQQHILEQEAELYVRLRDGLMILSGVTVYAPPPGTPCVGVLCLTVGDQDSSVVADALWQRHGIACRAGLHCAPSAHICYGTFKTGTVRLSAGWFNKEKDIDKALLAVKNMSRNIK
jgi:selenocysteine lyase/cysteine desulfurase